MTRPLPPIDIVLQDFFATVTQGRSGLRRRRIDNAERELRAFLEREGPRLVCEDCQAVIDLERQFGATHPFALLMFPDLLVVLLRAFLERPAPEQGLEQRRVEVRMVEGLAAYLNAYRLFDPREFLLEYVELQAALLDARRTLRREAELRRISALATSGRRGTTTARPRTGRDGG
jgi:hypothetical protein